MLVSFLPLPIPIDARTPIAKALAMVMGPLCAFLAHFVRFLPAKAAVIDRAHARILRIVQRLDRLAERWHANTLPTPRPGRKRKSQAKPKLRLPTGKAWMIRLVQPTAQLGGQVEAFLARPDTRALHEAAPQAGRLLRPLCRALGITPPDWLALPEKPRPKRAPKPRAKKGLLPTDRPIEPRVLAHARYLRKQERARRKNPA